MKGFSPFRRRRDWRYRHHLNDVSMVDSHCVGCKFVAVGAGNDVRTN